MSTHETTETSKNTGESVRRGSFRVPKIVVILVGISLSCAAVGLAWVITQPRNAPVQTYRVVNTYPHDANAFTQGLTFDENGQLYESTGLYNQTSIRQVDLETGKVTDQFDEMNPTVFGEGIAIVDDVIYQLTWRNRYAMAYDKKSLERGKKRYAYRGEGWGLTYDGTHLIMSNGTSRLKFLDPKNFRTVRVIRVYDGRREISQLNELEYINGEIYANVWHTDRLAKIDPRTGQVTGWIDLTGLLSPQEMSHDEAVLNGIAYNPKTKKLYVTGKNWPKLFEIAPPGN